MKYAEIYCGHVTQTMNVSLKLFDAAERSRLIKLR